MAFDDLPKIDNASENDDEAKTSFASAFSQKAGFIPREQIPDKGCDYFIELIQNKKATNWHFGTQLKSIENPKFITNNSLISYSWETSRLGYLMRHTPIYGLLVLYDVSTKKMYYEFVDNLVLRLMNDRDSEDWKENDLVNVHVPVANILDETSLGAIYQTFFNRHANLARMTSEQAAAYDLPVVKMNFVRDIDLDKIEDAVTVLKQWGISSILLNDLPIIYELVSKISTPEIVKDKELSILAALSNSEMGKIAESVFYIGRLRKRFEFSAGEDQMLKFIELKNDYALGLIETSGFISACRELLENTQDDNNKLVLRLNILFYELVQIKAFQNVPLEFEDEISNLADEIEKLEESPNKYYFKIWNIENLSVLIDHIRVENFNEMAIGEVLGKPLGLPERLIMFKSIIALQKLFMRELNSVDTYAKANKNYLLQSFAIHALTRFQLSIEIDMITFTDDPGDLAEREKRLKHEIFLGEHGFLTFYKNNLFSQAYNLLCLTYELSIIATDWYHFPDPIDIEKVKETLLALETELEIDKYESRTKKLIFKKRNKEDKTDESSGMKGLLLLNDEQIRNLAEVTLRTNRFPNAKLEHIMHELVSFKLFYERCADPDIFPEVIKPPIDQVYSFRPTFSLKNRKTGLVSLHNSDMNVLLDAWGL